MIFEYLKLNIEVSDELFDSIYPIPIRSLSKRHWTSVLVAKKAAQFLTEKTGAKVLDIGSGVGKFCMIGASTTKGIFTGIEQRENLYCISNVAKQKYAIHNVNFIHSNITDIDFQSYNSFYFYNSFNEHIDGSASIGTLISSDIQLYHLYNQYLYNQFVRMPIGTRLVTFWSAVKEVPPTFCLQHQSLDGRLKFWEKEK